MYLRVVRFTGVDPERVKELLARINSEGPPPDIPLSRIEMVLDETQQTAIVLQYFDSAQDMEAGAKVFEAMDTAETPGTRASVDMGEVKLDLSRS